MRYCFLFARPLLRQLVVLSLLLVAGAGWAQVSPPAAPPLLPPQTRPAPSASPEPQVRAWALPADHRVLSPRRPNEARLRALRSSPEFSYTEPVEESSFWQIFWRRLGEWLNKLMSSPGGELTWNTVFYTAIVLALAFAAFKLLQLNTTSLFGRRARTIPLPYDVAVENIHEVDFAARLAEAEAAGNYRLAVRLGYLALLKHFSDDGRLHWEADKTNHAYLLELPAGPLRESFRVVTRQFEYVWYGELSLTPAQYQRVRADQQAAATGSVSTAIPVAA